VHASGFKMNSSVVEGFLPEHNSLSSNITIIRGIDRFQRLFTYRSRAKLQKISLN